MQFRRILITFVEKLTFMKKMDLTVLIEKGENGYYIGQLEEYPPVVSQGKSIDELKENIKDALGLYLDVQKELLTNEYKKRKVLRRRISFANFYKIF
jgi:predicted RNase H-like HicB family nuclease